MNTRYLFGVIAAIVVLVIVFFAYNQSSHNDSMEQDEPAVTEQTEQSDDASAQPAENQEAEAVMPTDFVDQVNSDTGEPVMPHDPDIAVFEISYDGTNFSPSNLTIKNGDIVIFKNESSASFWPASGPHPQHTNYPEFDPKKPILAGQDWEFQFTKSGTWPFHNHLNDSVTGTITVE